MLGIAREEQSNPVELKIFRVTTGAYVVADATPVADCRARTSGCKHSPICNAVNRRSISVFCAM